MSSLEQISMTISCLATITYCTLGTMNYNLTKQTKKIKHYKKANLKSLENILGFLRLEEYYIEELSKHLNKSTNSIKLQFRKKLHPGIHNDFSGLKTVEGKISDLQNDQ